MVTIKEQCNATLVAGRAHLEAVQEAVKDGAKRALEAAGNAGAAAKKGAAVAGEFLTSPAAQRAAFGQVRGRVDGLYEKISTKAHQANAYLESKEDLLDKPITAMEGYKASLIEIKKTDSTNVKAAKKAVNLVKKFHEDVIVKGEYYSAKAGVKAHALTRAALTPITFVAKLLQVEVAGALIQNSIALAVGFAVRGIALALSQLAHLAPYAAAAAVVGGIGAGLAALAVKASPLAAVAVGLGLVMLSQQAQIAVISRDVNTLANAMNKANEKANEPGIFGSLLNRVAFWRAA